MFYPNCGNVRGPNSWGESLSYKKLGVAGVNVEVSWRDAGKTPRKKIQIFVLPKGHKKKKCQSPVFFTGEKVRLEPARPKIRGALRARMAKNQGCA